MRIGIIETGRPAGEIGLKHGHYPTMFERLLKPHMPEIDCPSWAALDGQTLPTPDACDGFLITGSAFGAYEDHQWIRDTETFVRACQAAGTPLVGICFGHQVIAQALGGQVGKSDKGWGVGIHHYTVAGDAAWMTGPKRFGAIVSHQDQVLEAPPGAEIIAQSDFCPVAGYRIGDTVFTLQCHPEMSTGFAADLYEFRRERIGSEMIDGALKTLNTEPDASLIAKWLVDFFRYSKQVA